MTRMISPAESRTGSGAIGCFYYRTEDGIWTAIDNGTGAFGTDDFMWPFGEPILQNNAFDEELVALKGPRPYGGTVFQRDRTSPDRVLRPVPGATVRHFRWPLVVGRKLANDASTTTDSIRLQLRGFFAVFNSDVNGDPFNDFSEDYLPEGSPEVRYRVFHNWDLDGQPYQYIAIEEDV